MVKRQPGLLERAEVAIAVITALQLTQTGAADAER
jgi:hypothetical protein